MILLDGHSLTPKARIRPESLSLTLKERESTATMVPDTMSGINTRSWFLDETNPGKGIVWRVRSIGNAYATDTPSVELEHVICALRDRILFGEVTTEMMGGSGTCTAEQAVRYILKKQSDWVLGKFGFSSVRNPYKFDGENLYDALVAVTKSLKNAWWSYDMSAYPFKLNITERPVTAVCELRAGRNLNSITRTQDLSNTYTRFYPIGKDDLHIRNNYVQRNTGTYGVIEHVEVNTSLETEAELTRWANEKLDVHAQPLDTIEIEGLELADATGESLDRLQLGRVCRVPLPEYGTIIEEKITQLRYADKIRAPEVVQITLANDQEDLAQVIADVIKEGAGPNGSGGRGGARQDKEDHAWFEDTDTHVAMVAEGIVGKDKDGNPDWARLSKIVVDGEGIHQTVSVVKEELGEMHSSVEQTESTIKQTVEAIGLNGKITAASICLAINNGGSSATIKADRIQLLGKTVAEQLSAYDVKVKSLSSARGGVNVYSVATTTFKQGDVTCYVPNAISSLRIQSTGNTYTLQRRRFNEDDWVDVGTFSRATDLTGAWGSGVFTVTATPQGKTLTTSLTAGAGSWSGRTVTIPIYATIGSSPTVHDTGKTATATFTAEKNDIIASRGNRQSGDPAHDSVITTVTQNGYYLITVQACGATRTYRLLVNVE